MLYHSKQLSAWSRNPLSFDCGFLLGWNGPVRLEPTKVIDADNICQLQHCAEASHPPFVHCWYWLIVLITPTVQGIAPTLTSFAEQVRRDAGDDLRSTGIGVKDKEFRAGPHFSTVKTDIDRDIADDFDT